MSRTSPLLFIVLVGLLGCAREQDSNSWRVETAKVHTIDVVNDDSAPSAVPEDGTEPANSRAAIARDFAAAIAERTRYGQHPDRCAVALITATGSEYRTFLTNLMAQRIAAGFRTLPNEGKFRYRIESIDMTDIGRAVLHTCSLDSVVLFDLGHSNDTAESTTNPIIVDDAVVSARTRWEIALESGRWKWVSARGTELNMEEDLCGFTAD